MMFFKSKAAKTRDALRQLQREYPQYEGMNAAIDGFLRSATPGTLNRLYDIVRESETKADALKAANS